MAGNNAFTNQGATPQYSALSATPPSYSALTPQAKALQSVGNGSSLNMSQFNDSVQKGMITPSTPLKKQTIATADGHTITNEYHAPAEDSSSGTLKPATSGPNAGIDPYTLKQTNPGLVPSSSASPVASPSPSASDSAAPAPAPTYAGLVGSVAAKASDPSAEYSDATQRARDAYKEAGDTNQVIGRSEQDALHNPNYSLDTGIGRAGQIASNYGLIGQNALTRAAGESALVGAANTQQSTQQSGLVSAAGLAAPQAYGLTTQPYNPVSDTYGGGGESGALGRANLAGKIGATQSNAQLGGTATPEAYGQIYTKALNDYTNLQQNVQNVDQFGSLLTSNMSSGGINPSDLKFASKTLAEIRGQLSSGAQAQYDTTLAALRSKISGMLSVGGNETPTAITADAQKILDGTLPLNQLSGVLGRIQQEGQILLQSQADKVNTAKTGIGSYGNSAAAGSSGSLSWDNI